MDLKAWSEEYSVGLKLLDEQHKKLINLTLKLSIVDSTNLPREEVGKILEELVDYIRIHFTTEEEILKIYRYPEYAIHKKKHEVFIHTIEAFMKDYNNGTFDITKTMQVFLKKWVKNHILKEDKKLTTFLAKNIIDV